MYGIYVVKVNQGLIPISRQRRATVANCNQTTTTVGTMINTRPRITPAVESVASHNAPIKIVKNATKVEMHNTPQYSLRVDLPLKERYLSIFRSKVIDEF